MQASSDPLSISEASPSLMSDSSPVRSPTGSDDDAWSSYSSSWEPDSSLCGAEPVSPIAVAQDTVLGPEFLSSFLRDYGYGELWAMWETVVDYNCCAAQSRRRHLANMMWHRFFTRHSCPLDSTPLHFLPATFSSVRKRWKEAPTDLFEGVVPELKRMLCDLSPEFIASVHHKRYSVARYWMNHMMSSCGPDVNLLDHFRSICLDPSPRWQPDVPDAQDNIFVDVDKDYLDLNRDAQGVALAVVRAHLSIPLPSRELARMLRHPDNYIKCQPLVEDVTIVARIAKCLDVRHVQYNSHSFRMKRRDAVVMHMCTTDRDGDYYVVFQSIPWDAQRPRRGIRRITLEPGNGFWIQDGANGNCVLHFLGSWRWHGVPLPDSYMASVASIRGHMARVRHQALLLAAAPPEDSCDSYA